jgi:uncharacterized protein YegL
MREDLTDISFLLDKSGSMQGLASDTIGSFNLFLKGQKEAPGEAVFSLTQFANESYKICVEQPIKEVLELDGKSYVADGESTSLNDSLANLIDQTGLRLAATPEAERPGKVLIVVLTDGLENSSDEFRGELGRQRVMEKVKHQREVYSWIFLFLGCNMDAVKVAEGYGISRSTSLTYAGTGIGVTGAMYVISGATCAIRASLSAQEAQLYCISDSDRKFQDSLIK